MADLRVGAQSRSDAHMQIWDSRYTPASQAFGAFREAVCTAFMPWTPERGNPEVAFEGRMETLLLDGGSVGLCATTGIRARKTKANIERSPVECVYGNYVLDGEISLEQADRRNVARTGDLILYKSHRPISLAEAPGRRNVNLAFSIPASRFAPTCDADGRFLNTLTPSAKLMEPLTGCFNVLARRIRSLSEEEAAALLDACVSLLPMASAREAAGDEAGADAPIRADVLKVVEDGLSNPALSPQWVADRLGVSTRQIHKLFARSGVTFGIYVTWERLERVRWELVAMPGPRAPISTLAYRWGFSDLSTFNRAFKRRYGLAPRALRA